MKIKRYVFNGFGFPIVLKNVPAREIRGSIEPVINYKELAIKVISELCSDENDSPLTGNQVRFLRNHLGMTTRQFGTFTDSTNAAVTKWENCKDEPTKMSSATETVLRLKILGKIGVEPAKFQQIFIKMHINREHENTALFQLSL